jgi:hypothetical protein
MISSVCTQETFKDATDVRVDGDETCGKQKIYGFDGLRVPGRKVTELARSAILLGARGMAGVVSAALMRTSWASAMGRAKMLGR